MRTVTVTVSEKLGKDGLVELIGAMSEDNKERFDVALKEVVSKMSSWAFERAIEHLSIKKRSQDMDEMLECPDQENEEI